MKRVMVSFKSLQKAAGETEEQKGNYPGTLRKDGEDFILNYREENGVKTALRINSAFVKTERDAGVRNTLLIEPGRVTRCNYKTPYGEMLLDIKAKEITICENDGGAVFAFSYKILQGGEEVTESEVSIACRYLD